MNLHPSKAFATIALVAVMSGCNSGSSTDEKGRPLGGAVLQSVDYGRLVDIYAYRRVDPVRADRRDSRNRRPVLMERDVLIRPDIETERLFSPTGVARLDANYRFLPFNVEVGHEQLLILWDDTIPPEKDRYDSAFKTATTGLPRVTPAFRGQDINKRPIPVVPRNAAICLNFDRDLDRSSSFFVANPNVVQVLEFISPLSARGAATFRPVARRIMSHGSRVVIDTSLIGGEASGGFNTEGLPASGNNSTANIRIALPTVGVISKILEFSADAIAEFNDVDSRGDSSVIRDFRSGNLADGAVGALSDVEAPTIVTHLRMGITAVDTKNRVLTINKRNHDVALRGRIPYVDGALDPVTGLALGPVVQPLAGPLRSGDVITQSVESNGETIRLRAEIVMNLDVGNVVDDPEFLGLGMYRKGSDPQKPGDGGQDAFARVQVTNISAVDAQGNAVTFAANPTPLGEDCEVRVTYYENVPYKLTFAGVINAVSDSKRRFSFLAVDPPPPVLGAGRQVNRGDVLQQVDPTAAIALQFSEPMNLETVRKFENYILTNDTFTSANVVELLQEPKPSGLAILATTRLDQGGDGTLLQLRPPLGHFHDKAGTNPEEPYWFHMILGKGSPTDMAGNRVDIFDRTTSPVTNFSVKYTLDKDAESNFVASRVFRFVNQDENGSAPGSQDAFGQFQLLDGELRAKPVSRFTAVAVDPLIASITRFERGECAIPGTPPAVPPTTAGFPPGGIPGILYQCPSMIATQLPPNIPLTFTPPPQTLPQTGGGVSEPHNARGSRLQMSYREDDFGLAYEDENTYMLDIEQMHWAPWNDAAVRFDVFDRYTLRMAHSDWRPDLTFFVAPGPPPVCVHDCFSGRSGLRATFDDNLLDGTAYETVVKDQQYEINPNDAFRAPATNTKFVPYPKFQKSYTWRDSRLVTWDMTADRAHGLGGAHRPAEPEGVRDTTTSASSPYVPNKPLANVAPLFTNAQFVFDYGDFHGFRTRDHDPVALPLLMDFSVFPDGPANGGAAVGKNQFHIALVGPCWTILSPGGYYSGTTLPGCGGIPWPEMRVHATGGIDQVSREAILVDPSTTTVAQGSVVKDLFYGDIVWGLFRAPAQDDHVHWAQADFVRRVSMVTYGFFDTLRPNVHDFNNPRNSLTTSWPGKLPQFSNGIPDLSAKSLGVAGISDLVTLLDPPQQPVGTKIIVEYRGAQTFDNSNKVFSQPDDFNAALNWNNAQLVQNRGNLLNPYYACEAYRYAMTNAFVPYRVPLTSIYPAGARVKASGLTPYVTRDRIDDIRGINGLLPRFLNFRIIMENNMVADPPISPKLKSFSVTYRVADGN